MNINSILLYILYICTSRIQAERLVKISQGLLNGTRFETRKGKNVTTFLGIPYAQPPIGELRFKSPQPAKTWDGVLLANKEANMCPQDLHGQIVGVEDCLYLNVFTPFLEFDSFKVNGTFKNKLLPVMVFVHGGGFSRESTELADYSPKFFMDKEIVFVSMNYRLGILGFFTTGDSVAPGNFGLKDQTLALKWVQENIQFFGGDPNRVTVIGNSAGATSVNLLALSDATNGLFNQYIIQSGSVMGSVLFRNSTEFKPELKHISQTLGCSTINSSVLVKCLREKSANELVSAMEYVNVQFPALVWIPTNEVESEDAFLTDSPLNLLAQHKMKDLPFLTGTVVDEGLISTSSFYANLSSVAVLPDLIDIYINFSLNGYYSSSNVSKSLQIIKDQYFNESVMSRPGDKLLENLTKFESDSKFFYPQVILLETMGKYVKSPVYSYLFGYRGSSTLFSLETNVTDNFGVAHGDELLYLFPMSNTVTPSKTDERVADLMIDLWTSFAIDGKPISNELDDPNMWQPYFESNTFIQIGDSKNNTDPHVTIEQEYYTERMKFWKENFAMV